MKIKNLKKRGTNGHLQNEREQFGNKLEAILTQKECDASHDKKEFETTIIDLKVKLHESEEKTDNVELAFKSMKKLIAEFIQAQANFNISANEAKATGSTGESSKKVEFKLPDVTSQADEFIKALEKVWRDREETFNENNIKVSIEELKNWEEKLAKMKESIKEKSQKIKELEDEKSNWNKNVQPLKDKIEALEENNKHLRRMLDEANMMSEGYIKSIKELEAHKLALATDVATLEEEVIVTRKHASERFELVRQKQEMESKLLKAEKNLKDLTNECKDFKERSKTFNDILNKNNYLESQLKFYKEDLTAQNKQLEEALQVERKQKNDLEQIRQLQDKAIHELYDNEKFLKQSIEKLSREYSDYKIEMEAYKKKSELNTSELKSSLRRIKKENDKLTEDNGKLIGDVTRLLETINHKKVQEIVTKQEKIIVESMAAHIRELQDLKYKYEQKLQLYEDLLKTNGIKIPEEQ